jgi:hypothetical protein
VFPRPFGLAEAMVRFRTAPEGDRSRPVPSIPESEIAGWRVTEVDVNWLVRSGRKTCEHVR